MVILNGLFFIVPINEISVLPLCNYTFRSNASREKWKRLSMKIGDDPVPIIFNGRIKP